MFHKYIKMLTDSLNEPFIEPLVSSVLSTLKFGLQQQLISKTSKLTPQDNLFLNDLIDNTNIVPETLRFLAELKQFRVLHVPQFVLFLSNQIQNLDKKKIAYNMLECIQYFAHAILLSNTIGLNATDLAILTNVLDASIALLEFNIQKPNSKGCFYFF
jgi:hypothetical protein